MRLLPVALVLVGLGFAITAFADAKSDAQKHIDKATKLFTDGKAAQALDELKTAYTLDPRPEILYAIGQAHSRLGQCDEARTYYERFLATRPAADIADATREAIAACKPKGAPTKADEAKKHVDNATALSAADKSLEAAAELNLAYELEPKPELLDAIAQAYAKAGECERARLYFDKFLSSGDPGEAAGPALAARDSCKPKVVPHAGPTRPRWYSDKLGVALAGGGAVFEVVGIVEYLGARSTRNEANSISVYDKYLEKIDSAKSQRTVAIVFGVAGTAALAAGLIHLVLHDRATEVQVTPTAGGAAVSIGARF
jgi:tetratricopeptide (TPR) repeat protein